MFNLDHFNVHGYALTSRLLTDDELTECIVPGEQTANDLDERRGGVRDIMSRVPKLKAIASHPAVRAIVDSILNREAVVVRSTFFDKTDAANWKVPWHQDVTIAVDEGRCVDGYGPWSIKQGIAHVQPPTHVLDRMVTIHIHLDPCPASNGALRVMPGSHRLGRIDQRDAVDQIDEAEVVTCALAEGEALVMRPLLIHSSSASETPKHRRVLHFDFSNAVLDGGLRWNHR